MKSEAAQRLCIVCNRPLKSAQSIARGYGARCAGSLPSNAQPPKTNHPATPTSTRQRARPAAQGSDRSVTLVDGQLPLTASDPQVPDAARSADPLPTPPPPTITRHIPVIYLDEDAASPTSTIGLGYDPDSRRLELLHRDGSISAYADVGPEVHDDLQTAGLGDTPDGWRTYYRSLSTAAALASSPAYRYGDGDRERQAAVRARCAVCGQFVAQVHHCPGPSSTGPQPPTQIRGGEAVSLRLETQSSSSPIAVRTYDLERVVDEAVSAPAGTTEVPLRAIVPAHRWNNDVRHVSDLDAALVEGTVAIRHLDGSLSYDGQGLRCDCPVYRRFHRCRHINDVLVAYNAALLEQQDGDNRSWTDQLAHLPQDSAEPPNPPVDLSTFAYTDNPDLFAHHVRDVINEPGAGVPFYGDDDDEPTAYGYGSGREFGIEIEYSIDTWGDAQDDNDDDKDDDSYWSDWGQDGKSSIPKDVANGLFDDGLTSHADIEQYGSIRGYYTREINGGWTAEEDSTVNGGEIISPILTHSGPAWDSVQRVCDRIRNCGGTDSHAAGSHVTVGAPDFHDSPAILNRLTALVYHYQADLGVMAAGDHGRSHLGRSEYAAHLPAPPPMGYVNASDAHRQLGGRYRTLNLTHINDADSGSWTDPNDTRIEFRLWDSTLDPGRIQAQAKISTALVDFAAAGGQTAGDHPDYRIASVPAPHHDPRGFSEATRAVRTLIDQLFHRDRDKKQAMALWAAGAKRTFGW